MPALTGVGYTATQIANLYFDPRGTILATDPTYVGNVTFGYTTTDTPGLTSAPALYTIAVGKDEKSTATSTTTKGGASKYQNNDPIVNLIDVNTVKYNTDGSLPYGKYLADRSVNANAANNGLTSVVQTGGTLAPGLALDAATGQIYVLDRTKLVAGTYSITVTTIDANGGTNTLTFPYTIGSPAAGGVDGLHGHGGAQPGRFAAVAHGPGEEQRPLRCGAQPQRHGLREN